MSRLTPLFILLALSCAADTIKVRPANWAQPVIASSLENFFRVSDDLYRSEQPKRSDISDLNALGIRTILSLRHYHQDPRDFVHANIATIQYQMDAGSVSVSGLIEVLRLIRTASKPILLHCWHGSDRTGFVVAGYRMVFMNWTSDQAIEELRLGGFGHHESVFPNIAETLKQMDVAKVRKAVLKDEVSPAIPNPTKPTVK